MVISNILTQSVSKLTKTNIKIIKQMKNKKEYTLTVEFINRKLIGKRIEKSLSGKRFSYKGKTKRECIWKAKLAGRYNSCYTKEWALVNNN